jgi:2-dehydro-3-deoxygalactonokinase
MHRIAVDWGSSCLRSFLLDQQGNLLASRQSDAGIFKLKHRQFANVIRQQCQDWLPECSLIMMAGMVGSRHGWHEVPYLPCPVNLPALAKASQLLPTELVAITTTEPELAAATLPPIRLVPGLRCTDSNGIADVMRGEETQIFGALNISGLDQAWLCLPGTHSKWALVQQGRIVRFQSFLSGELFAVLRQHSSLSAFCQQQSNDAGAFIKGVTQAAIEHSSLLHQLFSVRAQVLTAQLPEQSASDLLSGLIIGHELATARHRLTDHTPLLIVGNAELNQLYQQAAGFLGIVSKTISAEAASVAGFAAIAQEYD